MTTVAKPVVARPEARPGQSSPECLLAGQLRLDLSALGIDPAAPDFAERFFEMANENEPYTFEYSGNGELIVMPPAGWESNIGENETNADLAIWRRENGGYACSQNVQFQLPGGAIYIPDAAWITQERYDALRAGEYASTIPGAPDFVVEVRSRTDRVDASLAKMQEWMDGGSRLGWYIDPYQRRVHVFRVGQEVEVLEDPETLSGEDVLTGFVLEVRRPVFARYAEPNDNGD